MTPTASSEAPTPSAVVEITNWYVATRLCSVTALLFLGIVGNGFVLWFYGKNKRLTGQVYILALAVIDIVACVVILPQMPLFELEQDLNSLTISVVLSLESKLHIFSYFGVQVVYALDQFIAVYWPFKHARLRCWINYGTSVVVVGVILALEAWDIAALLLTGSITESVEFLRILVAGVGFSFTIILLVLYTATAIKLYRKNRTRRLSKSRLIELLNIEQTPNVELTRRRTRSIHIQALKIYTAIFVQFLFAIVVSGVLIGILKQRWTCYFFFINHVGNPVIYYCSVRRFKVGVNNAIAKLWGS